MASLVAGMEGADVVYHIAAAVDGFGPWSTFKTSTVDGAAFLRHDPS